MVVIAAGLRVFGGYIRGFVCVDGRRVGAEGDGVVAAGKICLGRLDRGDHAAGRGEMVDVWAVFVAYPECALRTEDKAFAVYTHTFTAWAGLAKAIPCVGCCGKEGEAWEA